MSSKKDQSTKSLFELDWYEKDNPRYDYACYPFEVERIASNSEVGVDDTESSAFSHSLEHEFNCYEPRGYISGPIELKPNYPDPYAGRSPQLGNLNLLPTIADSEFLEIKANNAKGILLVERSPFHRELAESPLIKEMKLSVISGAGIPRMTARRILRRIYKEAQLPVYLLVDNDTWGYFFYSLLVRGAIGPHANFPWAAIDKPIYLGISTSDIENLSIPKSSKRSERSCWELRVSAMKQFPCFQSREWQSELATFISQGFAVNLPDAITAAGGIEKFIAEYISPKLVS